MQLKTLNKNIILSFFIQACLLGTPLIAEDNKHVSAISPTPSWVKFSEFSLENKSANSNQKNFHYLLLEVQRNWEEKTLYKRSVFRPLNEAGVSYVSNYTIDFNPEYETVIFHTIRVCRNGVWSDRLASARHHLLQREADLERNVYDGCHTLVYFLDDIRTDDVVEYSFSKIGWNPSFSSHFSEFFNLQSTVPKEKVLFRLLAHPDHPFSIKSFNSSIVPSIEDLSPTLRVWSWEAAPMQAYDAEDNQPDWYAPYAHLQISEYKDWHEVTQELLSICCLTENFEANVSEEMESLVKGWTAKTQDKTEQATLALRFVQDQIRYLSLSDGVWAVKPADPRLVLQRRFGDCKDKTFLLHALLKLMDIRSTPALVHSSDGLSLPSFLPAPTLFNHAVLQIEIDGITYWADPTIILQGSSLTDSFFPNYHWALLLSEKTTDLTPIPQPTQNHPAVEITTSIDLSTPNFVMIHTETVYHGFKADEIRRSLARMGLEDLSKDYLKTAQSKYRGATSISPMEIEDDREQNILIRKESYRVPIRAYGGKKMLKIKARTLEDFLDSAIAPERNSPYKLTYPLWVKEDIYVENPFHIMEPGGFSIENEVLSYTYKIEKQGQKSHFQFELKNLQDHIPVHLIATYWNTINAIEPNPALEMALE